MPNREQDEADKAKAEARRIKADLASPRYRQRVVPVKTRARRGSEKPMPDDLDEI